MEIFNFDKLYLEMGDEALEDKDYIKAIKYYEKVRYRKNLNKETIRDALHKETVCHLYIDNNSEAYKLLLKYEIIGELKMTINMKFNLALVCYRLGMILESYRRYKELEKKGEIDAKKIAESMEKDFGLDLLIKERLEEVTFSE